MAMPYISFIYILFVNQSRATNSSKEEASTHPIRPQPRKSCITILDQKIQQITPRRLKDRGLSGKAVEVSESCAISLKLNSKGSGKVGEIVGGNCVFFKTVLY